jgi:uncharacterized protein (DUF58 family)
MIATRRLYLLLVAIAILFSLSFAINTLARLGFVCNVLIFLAAIADLFLTPQSSLLLAHRETSTRLSIGRDNAVRLYVKNDSSKTLTCKLRDDKPELIQTQIEEFHFTVLASQTVMLQYNLRPHRRGTYSFGNIYLRYKSTLGLFWRQINFQAQQTVKVYSDLQSLEELTIKLSRSTELGDLHKKKLGQGTDFAGLKDYVTGDDSKNIDWKATARFHRPIVRTFEVEQEQCLFVLLDAGRMMLSDLSGLTRFEYGLNASLSLILTALINRDQAGIGIFANKPLLYLPPKRGRSYINNILEKTYSIEPTMIEPDYTGMLAHFAQRLKGRSCIVVITDLVDAGGSQALLLGLAKLSKRHLTVCVTLKDQQVQVLATPPSLIIPGTKATNITMPAIFKRAVALDLLHERELSLSILQRAGCLVVDEAPENLTGKLIDKYLEVKSRELI